MTYRFLASLALCLMAAWSQAEVTVSNTRIIYRQADGEAVAQLRNVGTGPVLVQAWIDDGDPHARLETLDVPFTLVPSVARIDPDQGQALRILLTRDDLPADRESVFWLNVLEIPPKPDQSTEPAGNLLQFSFRSRLKLFFRPAGLAGTAEQAVGQLRFAFDASGPEPRLVVTNPSPYHLTFRTMALRPAPGEPAVAEMAPQAERMVAPVAQLSLSMTWLDGQTRLQGPMQVFFSVINDQGGTGRLHAARLDDYSGS